MQISQDEQFRAEAARFALRFTCEHCAHWDEARDRCAHGYPTAEHRLARYRDPGAEVVFCKDFDAG